MVGGLHQGAYCCREEAKEDIRQLPIHYSVLTEWMCTVCCVLNRQDSVYLNIHNTFTWEIAPRSSTSSDGVQETNWTPAQLSVRKQNFFVSSKSKHQQCLFLENLSKKLISPLTVYLSTDSAMHLKRESNHENKENWGIKDSSGDLRGQVNSLGHSEPWPDWLVSDPQGEVPPPSATFSSQRSHLHGKLSERVKKKNEGEGFNQEHHTTAGFWRTKKL